MARYELVKGMPVITMAEGKQVGKVDDLVVDPERKAVGWLRLHSGGMGMLGGERLWVPTAAVHSVGEDVVTINAEADARTPEEAPEALDLVKAKREIIGNKVITENGERLGEVRDYEFNPDTFALTSLTVPPGMNVVGELLTIAGDKILTIGEDVIVVAADAVMRLVTAADTGNQPSAGAQTDVTTASSTEPS
jgi:sporulation protein YlmC with PRC-barrel domain